MLLWGDILDPHELQGWEKQREKTGVVTNRPVITMLTESKVQARKLHKILKIFAQEKQYTVSRSNSESVS